MYHKFFEYNSNGFFIIRSHGRDLALSDANSSEQKWFDTWEGKDHYSAITFHPNNKLLITLMTPNNLLHYRDVETGNIINEEKINDSKYSPLSSLSVSPSGRKLLIVTNYQCFEEEIPFKLLYKNITKEKCALALWILKNYKDEYGNNMLPQELTHLLINKLLEACKY